ncbi:MAG: hypothetical protein E4H02_04185 [Lentisphaerales bacterium]|jgi:hypothetical protein|nr:MAG: hypothetical protein E4H02_04185 [Lentisphaerales bacterium]
MTLSVKCEVRKGYLHVTTTGRFDSDSANAVLTEWVGEARRTGMTSVLCDITRVTGFDAAESLLTDRYRINSAVAEEIRGMRLAVLANPEQLSLDKFEENVLDNRGAIALMTASLKDALEWLGVDSSDKRTD